MPVKHSKKPKQPSGIKPYQILILAGIILLISVILVFKNQPAKTAESTSLPLTAEEQLDRYLEEKEAVFVFFHSNNCYSCMVMIDTVNAVFPDYADSIKLVDVNVYDPQNQNLLARFNIRSIPTQIFVNREGQGKIILGAMTPEQLKQELSALVGDGE